MDPWASDYCVSYATTHALILLGTDFKFFIALLRDTINMYQLVCVCVCACGIQWVCILHSENTAQHPSLTTFHLIF